MELLLVKMVLLGSDKPVVKVIHNVAVFDLVSYIVAVVLESYTVVVFEWVSYSVVELELVN